ncbi:MAG: alpha/beta fold hydrolase [Rhodococcus sp. (in: high G+C Gram-positive bacteria)]|jgi:acyl-CoA synthetase (AMP-forming)/AMP-acid ligase II/thioesterase domain-containing protein/acyl carrier protein|nr:alpha/beta fold hydrolase [Rhodococcus sp. (in: high G+C Gram-positive bacteria)]MDI6630185.1 alpha/beta fold hydrolase [Rhodococcus sp. (in: high G+C Gram-positive bacteria)]
MSIQDIDAPTRLSLAPLCRPERRDTLMARYREVAHALPDAVALDVDGSSLTFDELLHRAYSLARKIATLFPADSRPLAMDTDATTDSIVLMLAVVAAGHPLVPLDPMLPGERRATIIDQAGATAIDSATVAAAMDSCVPLPTLSGDHTAVINYTSGSTGTAKGVILSHRMCLTKAYEVASALALGPQDRVGNSLPVSFGAGLNTLFAGLLSGAAVHCRDPRAGVPSSTVEWTAAHSLTTLHCSSSLLRAVSAADHGPTGRAVPALRVVITYGESLHADDADGFRRRFDSRATVVNWYATTEAGAVAYSEYPIERALPSGFLPAGRPIAGKLVEVVTSDGSSCAPDVIGEIRVTSSCLADGYLGGAGRDSQRFAALGDGLFRYRTGDLGRLDEHGTLHLAGRIDDAVKVRGYLVEPAEVEAALRAMPEIGDAAVIGRTSGTDTDLVAYVCSARSGRRPSVGEIRASLRRTLPEWMVPTHIVALDAMPRNERGKLDRGALPEPAERRDRSPAVGPTEYMVAAAAREAMGLDTLGRDEDFFELGGTSLTMTALLARLREELAVDLSPEDAFASTTIRTLARTIDGRLRDTASTRRRAAGEHDVLVPLRAGGTQPPIFLIGGAGTGAMGLLVLAKHIDAEHPVYALQAHGRSRRGRPDRTIPQMAKRYVEAIRTVLPEGPFHLVGHSLGGWIAIAMAQQIRDAGLGEPHLLILDIRLFRPILDRIPGGSDVPAAPVQTAVDPGFRIGVRGAIAHWLRVRAAGSMHFSTTNEWFVFASIGYKALSKHVITPWSGPMTVVRTAENVKDLRSWRTLARGELEFIDVEGAHVDMLREPMAKGIAKIVGDTFGGSR